MGDDTLKYLKIDKSSWGTGAQPAAQKGGGFARLRLKPWMRWATLACALVLAGLAFRLLFPPALEVETTSVSQVYPSLGATILNASGYVTAQRKASVASKTTARLIWLGVEEGSLVYEGEVIAKLERDDVLAANDRAEATLKASQADIESGRAELADATRNYERMKKLVDEHIISQSDFDTAEARYKKAKAALDAATWNTGASRAASRESQAALEYTLLRAPFDAVVLTKNADLGDIVTPLGAAANAKASVVTVADMHSLLVETDVSESNVAKVKDGQPCEITLDALPGERFPGFVHMIVPTADRSKASVMVKVTFRKLDPRILPEMSAKVAFLDHELGDSERSPRVAVPAGAVAERAGAKLVFVVENGVAKAATVETGARIGDFVELVRGPKPGTRVVLNPPARMGDGGKVSVRR
ncbi:MAG: efflux RND transporter periplasmic adaptor subunit [Humidesulfovibrio sp.]|nr:efflux RND transporter periplasmic adaptor subunit [Humidesulfovibrio sp.]